MKVPKKQNQTLEVGVCCCLTLEIPHPHRPGHFSHMCVSSWKGKVTIL